MKKALLQSSFIALLLFGCINTINAQSKDTLKAVIKLRAVNGYLIINGSQSPMGELETMYGVRIDSDDNMATGVDGYDLEISLSHTKETGGQKLATFKVGLTRGVWKLTSTSRTKIDTLYSVETNTADTTLILKVLKTNSELAKVKDGNRYIAINMTRNGNDFDGDTTMSAVIPAMVTDSRDMEKSSMDDILTAQLLNIKQPSNSLQYSKYNSNVKLYPQPMTSYAFIELNKAESVNLQIFNSQGQCIRSMDNIQGDLVKIERNNLPAGVYFYNVISKSNPVIIGKLVIAE